MYEVVWIILYSTFLQFIFTLFVIKKLIILKDNDNLNFFI